MTSYKIPEVRFENISGGGFLGIPANPRRIRSGQCFVLCIEQNMPIDGTFFHIRKLSLIGFELNVLPMQNEFDGPNKMMNNEYVGDPSYYKLLGYVIDLPSSSRISGLCMKGKSGWMKNE